MESAFNHLIFILILMFKQTLKRVKWVWVVFVMGQQYVGTISSCYDIKIWYKWYIWFTATHFNVSKKFTWIFAFFAQSSQMNWNRRNLEFTKSITWIKPAVSWLWLESLTNSTTDTVKKWFHFSIVQLNINNCCTQLVYISTKFRICVTLI